MKHDKQQSSHASAHDEHLEIEFAPLVRRVSDRVGDMHGYEHPAFAQWLSQTASARQTNSIRNETMRLADAFAHRMRAQIAMAQTVPKIPISPLRVRDAAVVGTIEQVASAARRAHCAPWLETLAVAAGEGREVWDEPCERWVELPPSLTLASHIAVNVTGDSMMPFLSSGDVLLVRVGAAPRVGDVVVARHHDHGYVVKRVAAMTMTEIELESFNPRYAPFRIARRADVVVGTVAGVLRDG